MENIDINNKLQLLFTSKSVIEAVVKVTKECAKEVM